MSHSGTRFKRGKAGNAVMFLFIAVIGIFMLIPFIYIINNAFKPIEELFRFPPRIFVQNPTLSNFVTMFNLLSETAMPFSRYVFNTVFLTVTGAAGQIILASLCAYSLAMIPFPGSKFVFKIIVFSLMFSSTVTAVPSTIIFARLGLIDTYAGMLLPVLVSTMGLYLMKQFMESAISPTLLEAGRIDGAGEGRIFWRVVMPLVKPAWLTLIIFSFQGLWNTSATVLIQREELKTLNNALSQIVSGGIARTGTAAAAAVIMMVVPIFVFVISQGSIVETVATSGMKD